MTAPETQRLLRLKLASDMDLSMVTGLNVPDVSSCPKVILDSDLCKQEFTTDLNQVITHLSSAIGTVAASMPVQPEMSST